MTDEQVEQAMEEVTNTLKFRGVPPAPTLSEQHAMFVRAGAELRRRLAEERIRLVSDHERRVMEYQERARRDVAAMQADLDAALRENALLAVKMA